MRRSKVDGSRNPQVGESIGGRSDGNATNLDSQTRGTSPTHMGQFNTKTHEATHALTTEEQQQRCMTMKGGDGNEQGDFLRFLQD